MVGDQESDVALGRELGMRTVRICEASERTIANFRFPKFSQISSFVKKDQT